MNYPPYNPNPNDPNDPHSQPTTAGQYPTFNQQPGQPPEYPQWGQQPPPPSQFPANPGQYSQSGQNFPPYPQPGQFGPPPPQPPGQPADALPPLRPYGNVITAILVLCCCVFAICLAIGNSAEPVGMGVLFGLLTSVLIMDWKGFTTLDGWINWKQIHGKNRFWLVCAYLFFFMFIIFVYVARHAFIAFNASKKGTSQLPTHKGRPVIGLVTGFTVGILVLAGSSGNASAGADTTTTTASAPTQQVAHTAPTQMPTPMPTATPTPSPTPSPTPTPVPAQPPVQQQTVQQQAPVQQAPPPAQLFVSFTGESAVDNSSGSVSVHTLAGAALTISVKYCTGSYATSSSLKGTEYADSAGNYTWTWVPDTKCKGTATAYVTASLNGQSASNSTNFTVS